MNSNIKYPKNIEKSFLFILIALTVTSCTTTQVASQGERDGIYYDPTENPVVVEKEVIEEKEPIVRLGGKYFNEDMEAPRSFEEEVYENDPIVSVVEPTTTNDYIQWGDYQGTDISFYASSPYGIHPRFYPSYYSGFNLGFSFGYGFGSSLYSPFYPYGYYNPYRYYGYYNPYYGYYNPYYGYYYNRFYSPYYNNYRHRNPYYGYAPIYRNVVPVYRGKGMNGNINNNVVNNRNSNNGNVIRRSSSTRVANSNNNNVSVRKRSLSEIRSTTRRSRSQYQRNSIRNSRNQNRVIYRRANTANNSSRSSRSSSWSKPAPTPSVKTSTPTRTSTTSTTSSGSRRIRR